MIFDSQADSARTRDDPEHQQWHERLLVLLEAEPLCAEGEITELIQGIQGL